MTTHTITLDGTFSVSKGPRDKSWTATVERDLTKFPTALVTDVFMHGLKQLGADAAAGATTYVEAIAAMDKKLDALWAGDWTSRSAGADGTRNLAVLRLYRAAMAKDVLKRFNGLAAEKQLELAVANVTDESAIAAEVVKIEAAREAARIEAEARKAQVAELAKGMTFDF